MPEEMHDDESKDENWVAMSSGYEPKKPGEDYVQDPDKARAMSESEKPYRDEKAKLKEEIPSVPAKPKEPSSFSRLTGMGMAKYEKEVAAREEAIAKQGEVIRDVVERGHELDEQAQAAAEKVEEEYVPSVTSGLASKPGDVSSSTPRQKPTVESLMRPEQEEK